MYSFENDYGEGAHERIFSALQQTNREQYPGYGTDDYCLEAKRLISRQLDGNDCGIHFLVGGTQTNLSVILAALRPHMAVLAADTAHIQVHETGAIEASGHRIIPLCSTDGKISPEQVDAFARAHMEDKYRIHSVRPGMVYISNPTELGTVYTRIQLQELYRVCRRHNLLLYVDGARLGCALVSEECGLTMADMARFTDAFSIGGTKLGALFGEALVIRNQAIDKDFPYIMKQRGALLAKGRLLGVQFCELFRDGLYFDIARHENRMARILSDGIESQGYAIAMPTQTNQVFAVFPPDILAKLEENYIFSPWGDMGDCQNVVRLCTSWATKQEVVAEFLSTLRNFNAREASISLENIDSSPFFSQ